MLVPYVKCHLTIHKLNQEVMQFRLHQGLQHDTIIKLFAMIELVCHDESYFEYRE